MQLKRDSEINCTLNRQYLQVKSENNTEKKTVHCRSNIEDFSRNVQKADNWVGLDSNL